ncbi:F-box protein CPR1-like [Henckelia pumila]|uniref:F-box protein CPR1-like n=1 Tax=Henckelia pumila TaxID=405737 RepID=UPI003C6E5D41
MNPRSQFLINLPSEIIIIILSRLPIRTILSCKCVCKPLLDLLSTPDFVASHLSLSPPGLLIRHMGGNGYGTCQIFEYEDDEFDLQPQNLHDHSVMKFNPSEFIGFSDLELWIDGSVNGIVCLHGHRAKSDDSLYLCNPITREYIALPSIEGILKHSETNEYGFGVSKISGQYKVLRNVRKQRSLNRQAAPPSTFRNFECLIYTVGTRSWRLIHPGKPVGNSHSPFGLFLNGNLHGLQEHAGDMLISCFDLETELYVPFPPPPQPLNSPPFGTLGILDGCLCFVDNFTQELPNVVIWVMKEYAVKESWTKQFVLAGSENFYGRFYDLLYPIQAFKNGDILLNFNNDKLLYFCNKNKACRDLDLVIQGGRGWTEVIPHRSSFLSLKIFDGENVLLF